MTEEDLRERAREAAAGRKSKGWHDPHYDDLNDRACPVLAFDQTLSSTGWVMFKPRGAGYKYFEIIERGTIKIATERQGHEGSLHKGEMLHAHLVALEARLPRPALVVAEQTPVKGYRLESSLMGAFAVRLVWPQARLISRRSATSRMLPPGERDEKRHTERLLWRFLDTGESGGKRWNEHERDALLLGLAAIYREQS